MTAPVDVARLRELLEKATPGEWYVHDGNRIHSRTDGRNCSVTNTERAEARGNLALIAELRNQAPALLSELDRLRKVEAAARHALTSLEADRELEQSRAADVLRAALAGAAT